MNPEPLQASDHEPVEKVVLLVHGHPDYSAGGGEMAAYSLFKALQTREPDRTWLISAITEDRARGDQDGRMIRVDGASDHEWAFVAQGSDWPDFRAASAEAMARELIPFLQAIDPDVVHVHHYLIFGVDLLRLLRRALPRARLVMTIHEFLAICARDGQMLTRPGETLCGKASPVRCTGCYPELARADVWRREQWFKRHLALVDQFTAPSAFARRRHVEWGLDPARIAVVPNAQIAAARPVAPEEPPRSDKVVFGFFGQINPYKGVDVLLGAAERLRALTDRPFEVQVHGVIQRHQPGLAESLAARFEALTPQVIYRGAYDGARVIELMRGVDYVVTPSIWWENSPVVIEEAFHARRPVICADIGGMAEKVEDGVNGLHFHARDPEALAQVMWRCVQDSGLARRLGAGARRLPSLEESDRAYRAIYRGARPQEQERR